MSDYGFAFAMLPLAFLAVICTASGLRSAYVCRVPGDTSVWFEGTAVLLACDLLLDCLDTVSYTHLTLPTIRLV